MKYNENMTLSLSGLWQFQLDQMGQGEKNQLFNQTLSDTISLPGTTDDAGFGWEPSCHTLRNLSRKHIFMGTAWYRREFTIPENCSHRGAILFLERCLWETTVWLDGRKLDTLNSLAAPHVRDLGFLAPGTHTLAIAVDNSNLKKPVDFESLMATVTDYRGMMELKSSINPLNKLNCGGHHTVFLMETFWNGILGDISLKFYDALSIEHLEIYPCPDLHSADIVPRLRNPDGFSGVLPLRYTVTDQDGKITARGEVSLELTGKSAETGRLHLDFPQTMTPWSDFHPTVYTLKLELDTGSSRSTAEAPFGLRILQSAGTKFLLNSTPVFLRGTVEDCTFPLSFAPPADEASWERIFRIARSYGLNHFRFHSFCPPDAAFTAADKAGFLLQVELPGTSGPNGDEEPEVTDFLSREMERILYFYGNHPSFALLSMGNEQLAEVMDTGAQARHQAKLMDKVSRAKSLDPRHLYTCTTHPYTSGRNDDYYVSAWTKEGWDTISDPEWHREGFGRFRTESSWSCFSRDTRWPAKDPRQSSVFGAGMPTLDKDYDKGMDGMDKPYISHEVGMWSVFPNMDEIPKYEPGVLFPGNFLIIKKGLEENGLLELAPEFVQASGQLSRILYRDEIETLLRSRSMSGFQLLDLFDYPGQGTSTVGMLDAFWDSKGILTPEEFRRFCDSRVLLARMEKQVWMEGDEIPVTAQIFCYHEQDFENVSVRWSFRDQDGKEEAAGVLPCLTVKNGTCTDCGSFSLRPRTLSKAREMELLLSVPEMGIENSWKLWIYPAPARKAPAAASEWNEDVKRRLENGEDVLLCPDHQGQIVPGTFTTAFWNPNMKQQVGTFGLLCRDKHPVFRDFPTSFHSDWQWWDVIQNSWSLVLGSLKIDPIIRVIDSFVTNRSLGMMWEARVGKGRLLICCTDLTKGDDRNPATRQLAAGIASYMESPDFAPRDSLSFEELDRIFIQE